MKHAKKTLTKADIIIYCAVLMTAVCILGSFFASRTDKAPSRLCIVSENGTEYRDISQNCEFDITSRGIHLTAVVKDGTVRVAEADCPDKCCKNRGAIDDCGESIVCLPAHITITLEGSGDFDAKVG